MSSHALPASCSVTMPPSTQTPPPTTEDTPAPANQDTCAPRSYGHTDQPPVNTPPSPAAAPHSGYSPPPNSTATPAHAQTAPPTPGNTTSAPPPNPPIQSLRHLPKPAPVPRPFVIHLRLLQLEMQVQYPHLRMVKHPLPLIQLRTVILQLLVPPHKRPDVIPIPPGVVRQKGKAVAPLARPIIQRPYQSPAPPPSPRGIPLTLIPHMCRPCLQTQGRRLTRPHIPQTFVRIRPVKIRIRQ